MRPMSMTDERYQSRVGCFSALMTHNKFKDDEAKMQPSKVESADELERRKVSAKRKARSEAARRALYKSVSLI